jgi:hypothetical protein
MSNSIAGVPSIVGEQFPDFVVKQIEQRQKIHGLTNRNTEQLHYLHAKTATCTLASSVDIKSFDRFKDTALAGFTQDFGEAKLAQMFVLENGVSSYEYDNVNKVYIKSSKAGINRSSQNSSLTTSTSTAYGFGGLEFGQVPMPGILSMTTRSENRGSLRTAEVRIKAFNKVQFDIIDTLFLRLGYTVLLEWKWGEYYDNSGVFQKDNPYTCIPQFLFPEKYWSGGQIDPATKSTIVDQDNYLSLIRSIKEKSNGNYDALLAKVKNFNWSFNKDGSYDITLSLVSIGDVIESLNVKLVDPKQGYLIADKKKNDEKIQRKELLDSSDDDNEVITAYKDTSALASYLYKLIKNNDAPDAAPLGTKLNVNDARSTNRFNIEHSNSDIQSILVAHSWQNENAYFVRFGHILDWIEKNLIISNKTSPGININTAQTPIYTHPDLVSTNLSICAINKRVHVRNVEISTDVLGTIVNWVTSLYWGTESETKTTTTDKGTEIRNALPNARPFLIDTKYNQGDLMNVYLNLRFILTTLESKTDENGKLSLLDFLTELCNGINNAFANVNKIAPVYDHDTNTVYFVDETPVDHDWVVDPPKAKFELYGYDPTNKTAGFIKDFHLKTEITPALATAITVGAQANAKPVGESQTSFSKWNIGLVDRIWKEKYASSTDSAPPTPEEKTKAEAITAQNTTNLIANYYSWIKTSTALITKENDADPSNKAGTKDQKIEEEALTGEFSPIMQSMINYHNQIWSNSTNVSGSSPTDVIGFIPINLSLTMDGISGAKIYQRFNVDTRFLPPKYTDELEFIVRGIGHTIENNQWTTNIETFMVPKIISSPDKSIITLGGNTKWSPAATAIVNNAMGLPSNIPKTSYPEVPFAPVPPSNLLPYKNAIKILKTITDINTAKATFAIMWAESAKKGESFKSAGGHNYAGVQTDSGRWGGSDKLIISQFTLVDSGNKVRNFAGFADDTEFLKFMASRVKAKEFNGSNANAWASKYLNSWVFLNLQAQNLTLYNTYLPQKIAIYNTAMAVFNSY